MRSEKFQFGSIPLSSAENRISEPKEKLLVAAGVSQRLLIGRAKKLIAQSEPAAQL